MRVTATRQLTQAALAALGVVVLTEVVAGQVAVRAIKAAIPQLKDTAEGLGTSPAATRLAEAAVVVQLKLEVMAAVLAEAKAAMALHHR